MSAAYRVLKRDGPASLSLRAVAKVAGVTPMAIYRHFENHDALLDALVLDGLAHWETRVRAIRARTPLARMEGAGEAFLNFFLEESAHFDAAFMLASPNARQFPSDFAAGRSPAVKLLMGDVKDAIARGDIEADSALDLWMTLWALGQGMVSLYRAGRFTSLAAFKSTYRRALRRLMQSFGAEKLA